MGKLKRFGEALGKGLTNLGSSAERVLKNLEDADKKMDAKLKKVSDVN